ncbi:MAG: branched-chain amino acid transaminase [Nitrospiria bacterium]
MINATSFIWMDGKLVPWEDAKIHVLTHTLHYGLGVFEGIRCYQGGGKTAVFRLKEHVERLLSSAKIVQMSIPFSRKEIEEAILETVRANQLEEGYIRPLAYIGYGEMGLYAKDAPINLSIAVWPWGTYLGDEGLRKGIRVMVSSFARHHVNISLTRAKITGNYTNSQFAKREAKEAGFDEAVLLDTDGFITEGPGENIFIVRNGVLKTTPMTSSILEGITRDAMMQLARERGIEVVEARFTRDDLYVADEAFFTGTAAEVTPIREVNGRTIGNGSPGPITRQLQKSFFDIVRNKVEDRHDWLTFV